MPRITVALNDSKVYVDGTAHDVDLSELPDFVHAIQWYGSYGEIEFKADRHGVKMPNLRFTDIGPYDYLVDRWKQKNEQAQQDRAKAKAEYDKKVKETNEARESALNQKVM
jgi:hypothetical protein